MKRIIFILGVVFVMNVVALAIYPPEEIWNAIFDPVTMTIKVVSISSGITNVSGSTVNVVISGSQILVPVDLQGQTFTLMVVDTTTAKAISDLSTVIVNGTTVTVHNLPATYPLPSAQETLLSRPTAHVDNFPTDYPDATAQSTLSNIETLLSAGTTTYESGPSKLYLGQTVYQSSGTSGVITSATSATLTITDRVRSWSFLYKVPDGSYASVESSLYGTKLYLTDNDYAEEEIVYPEACSFNLILQASATMTYVINTVK